MLLFTWSLFFLCLSYTTDGLLNTISASDKIIMELQRNMTKLQQQTEKTVLDQNRKILEMNNTIETQQRMITSLTAQVKEQNTTISTLRMNETFSAYQLILRDVVDRQNQHVNQTYNQIGVLDKTVSDLGKQFHYLSLSILDAEKKTSLLNTSLQGKYRHASELYLSSLFLFLSPASILYSFSTLACCNGCVVYFDQRYSTREHLKCPDSFDYESPAHTSLLPNSWIPYVLF